MPNTFRRHGKDGQDHELSAEEKAEVLAKINGDCGTDFKSLAAAERFLSRHPKLAEQYEMLIPESVVVRKINTVMGTDFQTSEEAFRFFDEHPDQKEILGKRLDEMTKE